MKELKVLSAKELLLNLNSLIEIETFEMGFNERMELIYEINLILLLMQVIM